MTHALIVLSILSHLLKRYLLVFKQLDKHTLSDGFPFSALCFGQLYLCGDLCRLIHLLLKAQIYQIQGIIHTVGIGNLDRDGIGLHLVGDA